MMAATNTESGVKIGIVKHNESPTPRRVMRRKGRRRVRAPDIDDDISIPFSANALPSLPSDNYRVVLRRRAVRKRSDGTDHENEHERDKKEGNGDDGHEESKTNDQSGDISLGMKLIVARGCVVVQNLNPLFDGRASPAQLVGVIKRGDILLSVNDVSLVNLSVDQLMEGLKPLSMPDKNGLFREILDLRFCTSGGAELLRKYEESQSRTEATQAHPDETERKQDGAEQSGGGFSLSMINPMPLFSSSKDHDNSRPDGFNGPDKLQSNDTLGETTSFSDLSISKVISSHRETERKRAQSEFFTMSQKHPRWMRAADTSEHVEYATAAEHDLAKVKLAEQVAKMMKIAKQFSYDIESIDKGKDMRSFQRWTSTISLRSRASIRRRHMLDSASLPAYKFDCEKNASIADDASGDGSESLEGVDGDELLLGLAANDEIWQRQVVEALNKAIDGMKVDQTNGESNDDSEPTEDSNSNIDSTLTAFLFGKNMTQIITKQKKSHALPPEEVTSVLFDLTTNIASSAPDEITVFDQSHFNPGSRAQWTVQSRRKEAIAARNNVLLATRFILDTALPLWLESFHPLPLEQRRVLWPRPKRTSADSHGGNSISDDSLTVDSMGSGPQSPSRANKDLREVIEDQQLDIDTRAETCFLTTFYFTQRLLSLYAKTQDETITSDRDKQVVDFVEKYGSYLQMHACLSYVAVVKARPVIDALLDVAQHDLSHQDAMREIQSRRLVLYDSSKLSAVVKSMQSIPKLSKADHRMKILNICVSAYPDIQPWQFKSACFGIHEDEKPSSAPSADDLSELYYEYISHLLHPIDGFDAARQDTELVKEWCELSVGARAPTKHPFIDKRRLNFVAVATKPATYHRDLMMLMDMSLAINEENLVLDLITEIVSDSKLITSEEVIRNVIGVLQKLSQAALRTDKDLGGFGKAKRILGLLRTLSMTNSPNCSMVARVPHELYALLSIWNGKIEALKESSHVLRLARFFTDASLPIDVIESFIVWVEHNDPGQILYDGLRHVLHHGVTEELHKEISGSLLRLKCSRFNSSEETLIAEGNDQHMEAVPHGLGVWSGMLEGSLPIDKQ